TLFKNPPPRSFKEWEFINETGDVFNLLVHCPHKARDENGEVLVEPIIEHQLAFGGCAQSPEKIRSLALSLYLRENASLLTGEFKEQGLLPLMNEEEVTAENNSRAIDHQHHHQTIIGLSKASMGKRQLYPRGKYKNLSSPTDLSNLRALAHKSK
ncbi:jg1359, partial [Pararge aegeria aegeria]